ncbi:DUF4859 domain-containing protein [Mucilaginibacter sp. UR6-1]|uniref:DUF4859 domain-containing protein n=1 Tax=Mucilaginibacter sp. UR6-1 TaxID=1435643 RepID=UPI001E489D9B|nr:DUF4859 domain-containing protein [Mucilaginibacter sp. UR6-1]MCC8407822.1 DUF4859 domain-containing protein [Mucilaginibacter sp. UR6-1]
MLAALLFSVCLPISGCKKQGAKPDNTEKPVVKPEPEPLKIYKPKEMQSMNWDSDTSKFCYARSKQSDHFILFWSKEYGKDLPSANTVPDAYRVDIDDLLSKAEVFYDLNVNKLKFSDISSGTSNLSKYKMMIFLYHQDTWLATGSGYDDTIGALWVSPSTCQPVSSVIAHEIGHSFQYQVACDLGLTHGFRYGYGTGGAGGNGYWEQTAQWQAYQAYPEEIFTNWQFADYLKNYNKHVIHEDYRYASYILNTYWAQKHGIDIVAKIWRQSVKPEDPIEAYQRLTGIDNAKFNDEIYDQAAKAVTWDMDALRNYGKPYIGKLDYKMNLLDDGWFEPDYSFCPQTTGFNVLPINVPDGGTTVSADFVGLVNAAGFNKVTNPADAGWRYGFVALMKDGTRAYGNSFSANEGKATFAIPANCDRLWFVVTGAPKTYTRHVWDDNNANDEQWPYKVKFANTNLLGYATPGTSASPKDVSFTYDVSITHDNTNYASAQVSVDVSKLIGSFLLQPTQLTSLMSSNIKFYAIESNGNLNANTTANGYGHWFDASGNVINWGNGAMIWSEYDEKNFNFTVGQYPGHVKTGDKFTLKQALVYTTPNNKTAQATFTFNVTIL